MNKQILQKTKHLEEVSVFLVPLEVMTVSKRREASRELMKESLVVQ